MKLNELKQYHENDEIDEGLRQKVIGALAAGSIAMSALNVPPQPTVKIDSIVHKVVVNGKPPARQHDNKYPAKGDDGKMYNYWREPFSKLASEIKPINNKHIKGAKK